ncbi:MAG: DMT family transporter [DPANN group archaeon]|nr:DMT family transporter [DPANN group archaeon]
MSAFFLSSSDTFAKKLLRGTEPSFVALSKSILVLLAVGVIALIFATPTHSKIIWLALAVGGFLEAVATLLWMNAIKISDFSKTVPFMALTPIGIAVISYFINGEFPTAAGLIGIVLVMAGGYTVNFDKAREGLHAPIKEILANKGTLLALLDVAVISTAVSISRFVVKRADPLFSLAVLLFFTVLFLTLFSIFQIKSIAGQFAQNSKQLLPIALFSSASSILSFFALSLTQAAYANTVKRLNVLFSVLYGHFIFKEKDIAQHLVAVVLMLAGIAILAIYG